MSGEVMHSTKVLKVFGGLRCREQEYRISVERRWRTVLTKRLN
jgi:hypothetical protein